jgi:hypothetical protein
MSSFSRAEIALFHQIRMLADIPDEYRCSRIPRNFCAIINELTRLTKEISGVCRDRGQAEEIAANQWQVCRSDRGNS